MFLQSRIASRWIDKKARLIVLSLNLLLAVHSRAQLVDAQFNPGSGADSFVEHVLPLPDGKVLICGLFWYFNGQNAPFIARLNEDGTLDSTFKTGLVDYWVRHMAVQSDGKIIIAGAFTSVAGVSRSLIARLNPDGSLDSTFNPGAGFQDKIVPADPNPPLIFWTALQPDGKIVVVGSFATFNGRMMRGVARLNPDGTLDSTFSTGAGLDSWARFVRLLSNGQILITGWFVNYNGFACNRMVRLNSDGSVDTSFRAYFGDKTAIYAAAILPDNRMIVSGHTKSEIGEFSRHIARLNPDGTQDPTFLAHSNDRTESILLQPDGKIVITGFFTQVDGTPRTGVARLNSDGSLDTSFRADTDNWVWMSAIDRKNRLMLSGMFRTLNGSTASTIARFQAASTAPAPALSVTGVNANAMYFGWIDNAVGRTGYTLQQRVGTDFLAISSLSSSARTYSVNDLALNTSYTFRLRADNSDGTFVYSNEASGTTPAATPQGAIVLSAGYPSSGSLLLSWSDSSSRTSYSVEWKTATGFTVFGPAAPSVRLYTASGLASGTSYTFRVKGLNTDGTAVYSNEALATTTSVQSSNDVPPTLTSGYPTTSSLLLSWNDSKVRTDYNVEWQVGGAFALFGTAGPSIRLYTASGLAPGTTYTFRVHALNADGSSIYSNPYSLSTSSAGSTPNSELSLTVGYPSASSLLLSLTDADLSSRAGYMVEWKIGSVFSDFAPAPQGTRLFTTSGLKSGTQYIFRIRANNTDGTVNYSNEATGTTSSTGGT